MINHKERTKIYFFHSDNRLLEGSFKARPLLSTDAQLRPRNSEYIQVPELTL